MNPDRLTKSYLPIWWYLAIFLVVAIIPAGVSTYFSVKKADAIEVQAQLETEKRAREKLLREVEHLGDELSDIAHQLADWDETLALFVDATYYNYWKETRVPAVAQYRNLINAVDLYDAKGVPLTADVTLAPHVHKDATHRPGLVHDDTTVFLIYFFPVAALAPNNTLPQGYVGVRIDLDRALRDSEILAASSIRRIDWHLPDSTVMAATDAVGAATLAIEPSPEINALSQLVRHSFVEYLVYTIGLLLVLAIALSLALARPLRRLTRYLHEIYAGTASNIPDDIHGAVRIRELENVRQALNDYKDRFQLATTTLEERNKELMYLTYHDPLTGRYNRRAFEARLEHAIETAVVESKSHALCYIDLDQFKVVNDTCGHVAGDELLKQIATLLEGETRSADMVARIGGDEFGVLLEGCALDKAVEHAEAMRMNVKLHRFAWQGRPFDTSVSIGVVPITAATASLAETLKNADAACYIAKDSGRNRIHVYEPHDQDIAQRYGEMQWVSRLKQALDENWFELHGLRIEPTDGRAHTPHFEVLIRLREPGGELILPMAFIPAAERYNLMSLIDRWVIDHTLTLLAEPRKREGSPMVSINLSGQSMGNSDILTSIRNGIAKTGIAPERLCFEITETAAITNLAAAIRFIRDLREIGCRFSLDDFGSGLSSFGYLSNLAVDYIKIDGHFIKQIKSDPLSRSIVGAINQIGHALGIQTVAEFVENKETITELEKLGVDFIQGTAVHRPEPLRDLLSTKPALKRATS